MKAGALITPSIHHPKVVVAFLVALTLFLGAFMVKVQVDTDPENMLAEDEAVRVFHNQVKKEFTLHDVVVLGVVNESHKDGVFNPATLRHVESLTDFAMTLADPEDPERRVVEQDLMAPGNVDTIEQAGPGQVRFEWLMKKAPTTREGALRIRDSAMANPLLKGTLVSEDGKALCIYIPITSKDFAYQVRERLLEKIATFDDSAGDKFYITGLPVAEDTFGVEMFVQMAVSAPLAMLAIFLLMLLFFRKIQLIISPMIIAMMTVISTMGLLIGTGHTVHIMSSMIPIFLMPIAVVDSIHILSEFFDEYQKRKDRRQTLEHVLDQLFLPMFYTSLTSSAGFLSLALTPIPPVQAFGIFVAIGIMLAWLLTIVFIPAYIMLMKEESLADFGVNHETVTGANNCFICRHLRWLGGYAYSHAKLIVVLAALLFIVGGYGVSKIQINDNPIKWFTEDHGIRVADRVLNEHFGGTYEAYLILEGVESEFDAGQAARLVRQGLDAVLSGPAATGVRQEAEAVITAALGEAGTAEEFLNGLLGRFEERLDGADDASYDFWDDAVGSIDAVRNRGEIFKRPDVLRYIAGLQEHLVQAGTVGKSNSVTDVVKKVHQELYESDLAYFRVPDTVGAVAQCLISFQNSHKPNDLWHLVTPDYRKANLWVQLKNGDNMVMEATVRDVEQYFVDNPPPVALSHNWAGLTYLNVVWQDKMVTGMLESFLSSFVVVFLMMALLFRSFIWGGLAMIPLSLTIVLIYGIIGFIGKDYDMPVAVLSSLSLGLAVDFAIHFLERARTAFKETGAWRDALRTMFEEPARAITRNVIVIAVGFLPLLAAPLVPYKTVGVFLASIMAISGLTTMFILPSIMTMFERFLFRKINP